MNSSTRMIHKENFDKVMMGNQPLSRKDETELKKLLRNSKSLSEKLLNLKEEMTQKSQNLFHFNLSNY